MVLGRTGVYLLGGLTPVCYRFGSDCIWFLPENGGLTHVQTNYSQLSKIYHSTDRSLKMRHKIKLSLVLGSFIAFSAMMAVPAESFAAVFQQEQAEKARGQASRAAGQARGAEGQARGQAKKAEAEARNEARKAEEAGEEAVEELEEELEQVGEEAQERAAQGRERAAQARERGEAMRASRGQSQDRLLEQVAGARDREVERHERRIARIEEIRQHAEADGNAEAVERVNALVEKEHTQHAQKMAQIEEMEVRIQRGKDKVMKEKEMDEEHGEDHEHEEEQEEGENNDA